MKKHTRLPRQKQEQAKPDVRNLSRRADRLNKQQTGMPYFFIPQDDKKWYKKHYSIAGCRYLYATPCFR
jgi:hypothetical protein